MADDRRRAPSEESLPSINVIIKVFNYRYNSESLEPATQDGRAIR